MEEERQKIHISIRGIITDLHNGVTRCKNDSGYDETRGSIEEKYQLTKKEISEIFKHPLLMGRKVIVPKVLRYELIEDLDVPVKETTIEKNADTITDIAADNATNVPKKSKYGRPSKKNTELVENNTADETAV
jgi:hypothetical protein